MPGPWEWVIIVLAVLLIFGAKRLPEIAKALGKSIQEFRKASHDIKDAIEEPQDQKKTDTEKINNEKKDLSSNGFKDGK